MNAVNAAGSRLGSAIRVALAVLLALSVSFHARSANATITGSWVGDFSIPAFDGRVSTCAILDGSYVVGGDFRWAAEVPAHNVAMWTGSDWAQVGLGLPSPVRRLAVSSNRELLAATDSYLSGVSPVMRFNGAVWRPVGNGLFGEVDALLIDGPYVYAAGMLYQIGDVNAFRVLRWDGVEWQPVGGGFDNRILCLAMFQGALYAGGDFLSAGNTFVSRIARWDGAQWGEVGGGTGAGGSEGVAALTEFSGRLIAGGWFSSMGGVETRGIAAWDGNAWEALPNLPQDVIVRDLQVEGSLLHVAGVLQVPNQWAAGLVTFDGQAWSPPPLYPNWSIEDIAIGNGALIAVGDHASLVQGIYGAIPNRDVVVRDPVWHGLTPWRSTMRGLLGPSWTQVSALSNYRGELYAGGYFQFAADPPYWIDMPAIARWDGVAWKPVGEHLFGWVMEMAQWGERLVVGGPGFSVGSQASSILAWDGNSWSDLGQRVEGWVGGLTEWQGGLVACGHLRLPGSSDPVNVAVHRGSGWERLGSLALQDQSALTDVAAFGGSLFLAGRVPVPGIGWRGVMRWNGTEWVDVPNNPLSMAECLLVRQDGLWVGSSANGLQVGGAVWKWDGVSWTSMGELVGTVLDLIEIDGTVIASGSLFMPGGRTSLAQWNGSQWQAIPGAPEDPVQTMASVGRDLWIGGWFTSAGERQVEAIARWRRDLPSPATRLQMMQPWPTPARDRVAFRFTLPADGRVELRIHDLRGALVARPIDEHLPAGTHERTWSIATAPKPIRPGVYFARLVTPTETIGARIVIAASGPGPAWSPRQP